MALVKTTLAAACSLNATKIVVASATGFAAGVRVKVDQEEMVVAGGYSNTNDGVNVDVIRAQGGTVAQAHVSGANVIHGVGSDWADPDPQLAVTTPIAGRARTLISYAADGAISLPTAGNDAVAVLNGTAALAMTLANPGKALDGSLLFIVANGKAAHTVTPATAIGDGGSNLDLWTFAAGGRNSMLLMAINEIWVIVPSFYAGTLTNVTVTAS